MSRNTSQSQMRAMAAESSGKVVTVLLEITHESLDKPLRFCQNTEDITFEGNNYQYYPFEVKFPQISGDDQKIKSQIQIGNIDQQIMATLRSIQSQPKFRLVAGYINDQLTVTDAIVEIGGLFMKGFSADRKAINGTISYKENFLNEPFLSRTVNPATASAAF